MNQANITESIAYAKELRLRGELPEDFDGFFFRYDAYMYSANISLERLLNDRMVVSLTDTDLKKTLLANTAASECMGTHNCTCRPCTNAFSQEIAMISDNLSFLNGSHYRDLVAVGYIYRGYFYNCRFPLKRAHQMPAGTGPNDCPHCRDSHYKVDCERGFCDYCMECAKCE
jgi:hypothetical protein